MNYCAIIIVKIKNKKIPFFGKLMIINVYNGEDEQQLFPQVLIQVSVRLLHSFLFNKQTPLCSILELNCGLALVG